MANRELFLKAAATSQLVGRIVEGRLESIGIPAYLLAVLTHVRDLAPVSPSRVSAVSGMPATTLRDNIQRLVDRRLVRRVPNPDDGRSYLLVATPRGVEVAAAAGEALHTAYVDLEQRLPLPLRDYEAVLDQLNAALSAAVDAEARTTG